MAALKTTPGTSTAKQRKSIMIAARRHGFSVEKVRGMAGCNLHDLSSAEASAMIKRLSGSDLANPPGQKPKAYQGKPGGIRLRTEDQVQQITRLGLQCFDNDEAAFEGWLYNNFNAATPTQIETAKRASVIIVVLKRMLKRKESTV